MGAGSMKNSIMMNRSGFGLLSTIIAMGIASMLALGVSEQLMFMFRTTKSISQSGEFQQSVNMVRMGLAI